MLSLTRKTGESIMIGDDVKIVITGIMNGHVQMAFHAPDDVAIWRQEIYDKMNKKDDNFGNR